MSSIPMVTIVEISKGNVKTAHRAPLPPTNEHNEEEYDDLTYFSDRCRALVSVRIAWGLPVPDDRWWVYWSDDDYQNQNRLSERLGASPPETIEWSNLGSMLEHIRNISWL